MARRFAAALLCAFALALGAAPLRAEIATGGIYVTTLPTGADVWIDGSYVGRAPALVDGLARGRHTLTLTKTGWVAQEVDVDVATGTIAMSSVRLLANPRTAASHPLGSVVLREVPAGAAVAIDGFRYDGDVTKPISMPAGLHRITIDTPKARRSRSVAVLAETTTFVVVRDPAPDVRAGVVAPADAYLPPGALTVEGRKIVIRHEGHLIVAHIGDPSVRYDGARLVFDSPPETIGRKLYLPLDLLQRIAAETPRPESSR